MERDKPIKLIFLTSISIILLIVLLIGCENSVITQSNPIAEFANEQKVKIIGYSSDAMEPFISKDGKYLFFNNLKGPNKKDIYYAKKINDTTFAFKGEVEGVNSTAIDANPTMDKNNNFYFISTRNLSKSCKTIYCGTFNNGKVTKLHQVYGSINIATPSWINMGVEVSKNGNTLYVSSAKFVLGKSYPEKGNIRFAVKTGDKFNVPYNESNILENINTKKSIEYAGELSSNGLELFYSQVTLSNPPVYKLYYAKRDTINGKFKKPIPIMEPFKNNPYAIVEAPTLSNDGKKLYYHKFDGKVFSIFMLSRKDRTK